MLSRKSSPQTGTPISKMQSLLGRGKAFLTPRGSSTNLTSKAEFTTAKTESALFQTTDPKTDGEECLHDCETCTVHYPNKFSIDEDDKLYGHVKGWDTHLIVGTGKTDWVRDVADEAGSVMEAVGKYGQEIEMSAGRGTGKIMLSASNMPTGSSNGDDDLDEGSNCILLPAWTMIDHVKPDQVPVLMREVIGRSVTNKSPLKPNANKAHTEGSNTPAQDLPDLSAIHLNGAPQPPLPTTTTTDPSIPAPPQSPQLTLPQNLFRTRPCPHRALILMCSHKTRDARCGQSAPLLRKEFERQLRPLGLYRDIHDERPGGVGIYYINHVGGHKYSANVMIYRRSGSVRPSASGVLDDLNGENEEITGGGSSGGGGGGTEGWSWAREAIQGIWLARVRPEDCENIVRFTVLQGKVVKPGTQLRGGFDREKGLVSW